MRHRTLGSTGRTTSVIGQGTWKLEADDCASAIAALRAGLDAGMSHVDTAELYGDGRVEEIVGEALAGRRDEVFLVSKVMPTNASRRGTVQACERSLRRLRTDRLDAYLLHWPGRHPLADTLAAFEELRQAGKIGAWGVSNFDDEGIEEAAAIAGPGRLACDQVLYHLEERGVEHAVLPACRRHGAALVGYSPFGSGHFPRPSSRGGRALADIARERGATPHQIALAFLVHEEGTFTIPKTGRPERALENAAAGDLALAPEEIRRIEDAFPRGPRPSHLPTI
jgi:diketogulonate reductase-like aldo/keto reductase